MRQKKQLYLPHCEGLCVLTLKWSNTLNREQEEQVKGILAVWLVRLYCWEINQGYFKGKLDEIKKGESKLHSAGPTVSLVSW